MGITQTCHVLTYHDLNMTVTASVLDILDVLITKNSTSFLEPEVLDSQNDLVWPNLAFPESRTLCILL